MATNQKSGPTPDLQGTKVAATALAGGALPGADAVGVDKIRDLLFGNQMQDYERRFVTLEDGSCRSSGRLSRRSLAA